MVEITDIIADRNRSTYMTMISGDNDEKYFVRTVPDIRKFAHVRTIIYKRVPNNPIAQEVVGWSRHGYGYIKSGSHDPVVSFIAQNFDNLDDIAKNLNIGFQEVAC